MNFRNKTIKGTTFDLSHLNPFEISVSPKAPKAPVFRVGVSFNSHVFTRNLVAADSPDLRYRDGNEERAFCIERYELSLRLPSIILAAAHRKAYFSAERNYLLIDGIDGVAGPYAVFFSMTRAKRPPVDARMFVVSAYAKPALPRRLPSISFATLVAKTARGEVIKRPQK